VWRHTVVVNPVMLNVYAVPGTVTFVTVGTTAAASADSTLSVMGNGTTLTCSVTYMAVN